jgi:hypothetical protein
MAVAAVIVLATAVVVAVVTGVVAVPAVVARAGARAGQYEAAGGAQGKSEEQAADEFHLGSPVEGRGRNGAAIDPGRMDRKNLRLNASRFRRPGFRRHSGW